jgi:hypothetical protein
MDRQTIFNQVYNGLKAQGFEKSMQDTADDALCAYRGVGGLKCAVGQIIPDEKYQSVFEDWTLSKILKTVFSFDFDVRHSRLLADLQEAHDGAYDPDSMKARLIGVAYHYHVEIPRD